MTHQQQEVKEHGDLMKWLDLLFAKNHIDLPCPMRMALIEKFTEREHLGAVRAISNARESLENLRYPRSRE